MPSDLNPSSNTANDQSEDVGELFQIIDETGEGFGFDLTPQALARPLMIGTGTLFGVGMLAGVPIGLAMGRADESGKGLPGSRPPRPTFEGLKFAASTFGLGTLLCAAMGASAFYAIKSYYRVETFEQFGAAMREAVPARRTEIEATLAPVLDSVRQAAGDTLPAPVERWQQRFSDSRLGHWISAQVESAVTATVTDKDATEHNDMTGESPSS